MHLLSFNYREQCSHFHGRVNYSTFTNGEAEETEILRRLQDPSGWDNPSADTARRFLAFPETNGLFLSICLLSRYTSLSPKSRNHFPVVRVPSSLYNSFPFATPLLPDDFSFFRRRAGSPPGSASIRMKLHRKRLALCPRRWIDSAQETKGAEGRGEKRRKKNNKKKRTAWPIEQGGLRETQKGYVPEDYRTDAMQINFWAGFGHPQKELKTSRTIAPARWRLDFRVVHLRFRHRLAIPR